MSKRTLINLGIFSFIALMSFAGIWSVITRNSNCLNSELSEEPASIHLQNNNDVETAKRIVLQTKEDIDDWEQKISLFSSESAWSGWATKIKIIPSSNVTFFSHIENPILISAETETTVFLLVRNGWKLPHTLRIITLLEFQPTSVVLANGSESNFYDLLDMAPQEDRVFVFTLPNLSQGFHQLSILLVADPESVSFDKEYRLLQQKSFNEQRFDLWAGLEKPPANTPYFASAAIGQSAASRVGGIEFVSLSGNQNVLKPQTFRSGDKICATLRLIITKGDTYEESIPLRIGIFWNDKLEQILDYKLPPRAFDNLSLTIKVQIPQHSGNYQFNAVLFTFPGYSQFDSVTERTGYPLGAFTQRVIVEATP